jgi:hypothetical protein
VKTKVAPDSAAPPLNVWIKKGFSTTTPFVSAVFALVSFLSEGAADECAPFFQRRAVEYPSIESSRAFISTPYS